SPNRHLQHRPHRQHFWCSMKIANKVAAVIPSAARDLLFLFLLLSPLPASAQGPVTGTPPFGSYSGGPDIINLANLNAHLTIPILSKPGRGIPFSYNLAYDSSVWFPVGSSGGQSWQPVLNFGWAGLTQVAVGYISYGVQSGTFPCNPPTDWSLVSYTA